MASILAKVLKWTIILCLFVFLIHCWLMTKSYTFSKDKIAAFAEKHVGKQPEEAFAAIYKDIKTAYPALILPEHDLQWLFMNAGGWMGAMCLLHGSLTEYILFFGSAIDTSGHSGRYWANISDTVLTGEFRQWKEGTLKTTVHKPGETIVHAWGEVTAVHFKGGTWMVEYGRGFIPSTLAFALADTLFSTLDFVTLFNVFKVYTKALVQDFTVWTYYYVMSATNVGYGDSKP